MTASPVGSNPISYQDHLTLILDMPRMHKTISKLMPSIWHITLVLKYSRTSPDDCRPEGAQTTSLTLQRARNVDIPIVVVKSADLN